MTSSSTGSTFLPSISLVTISGRETWISNPSRRIISIRIDSCSSPRPTTFICSGVSVGSTRMETLPTSSRSSRSFSCRDVTYCPSRPAIGDVLTPKIIDTVGSSIATGGIAMPMLGVGDGLADGDVLDAGEADDVAGSGLLDFDPLQAVEGVELGHLRFVDQVVELADDDRIANLDAAVEDAADGDAADVIARIEVGDENLERRVGVAARRRHVLDNRVEQRPQIGAGCVLIAARSPDPGVRVQDRKVELLLRRVEIDEEVVDLVEHFLRTRIGPIDLVDDDDRRQPALQRLAQHEARLGQRTLRRVDEQHHAVHHRQRPLHLPAEVGVARRVDDVDEQVLVMDRGVLGQDGDAPLALEVGVVHRALGDPLVRAERAALMQQPVDERRLAVVDVGDDGDVAAERVGDVTAAGKGRMFFYGHRHLPRVYLVPPGDRRLRPSASDTLDCNRLHTP